MVVVKKETKEAEKQRNNQLTWDIKQLKLDPKTVKAQA